MKKRYTRSFIIAIIVFTLDQISKFLVREYLPLHHSIEVIKGFFNIVHFQNPGIIFGILSQSTTTFTHYLLITVPLLAIILLIFFIHSLKDDDNFLLVAVSLILGGATGNLVDRVIYKKVIDFLDFYWNTYHWPAFNLADTVISIGIILFVIHILVDGNHPLIRKK